MYHIHDDFTLAQLESSSDPNYILPREVVADKLQHAPGDGPADIPKALAEYNTCIDQLFIAGTPEKRYPAMFGSRAFAQTLHSASLIRCRPEELVPRLFYKRGNVLWNLGQWDAAIRDYEVLRAISPVNDAGVLRLAESHKTAGDSFKAHHDYTMAEENYRAALALKQVVGGRK